MSTTREQSMAAHPAGSRTIHEEYEDAVRAASATKPADCTCDGLHTAHVHQTISLQCLDLMIQAEKAYGCPAEARALVRIFAARVNHIGQFGQY